MPSASDHLREKMLSYFGDPIDDAGPAKFLRSCGWTEDRDVWSAPLHRETTSKEWDCMQFLVDEWDHGFRGRP